MSEYVRFTSQPLPEVEAGTISGAQQLFEPMYKLQLPGFVIRQADIRSIYNLRPDYNLGGSDIGIEPCSVVYGGDTSWRNGDFGLHRDVLEEPRKPGCLFNIHTTTVGEVAVRMFLAQPMVVNDWLPVFSDDKEQNALDLLAYEQGRIDSELFLPTCYTTTLAAGDSLVFLDWLTAHDFLTTEGPRVYDSGLYLAHAA